jgi:predicted MPP superfamily phosphohydrolase
MSTQSPSSRKLSSRLAEKAWNLWCLGSVIGIWPRFIEPYCLTTRRLSLPIPQLPSRLEGLKILQFSDLHLNHQLPNFFLKKIAKRIGQLSPDLIVFTGDFLCCSRPPDEKRLCDFLCALSAPLGCYAVLGNHDYSHFVSINDQGEYDCIERDGPPIIKGFQRLFSPLTALKKKTTERAYRLDFQEDLIRALRKTPFRLLHNETVQVPVGDTSLNLCGLGEYQLAHFRPEEAFRSYDRNYPGIILSHNPDTFPLLENYPGELILSGHTHGGQIYLPGIWKRLTQMENLQYRSGLFQFANKYGYVNRGIGATLKFRWFAPPELTLIELRGCSKGRKR